MIDPDNVPHVEPDEMLARYIVAGETVRSLRKYVREDETVKPQLFIPYHYVELSVNRHRDCNEDEIWRFGFSVAEQRAMTFHGRSDISASDCTFDPLSVLAKPIRNNLPDATDNPNHADIVGYPSEKADQKSLALKLAAKASKRKTPEPEDYGTDSQ
ncbi:hypothetical protein ACFL2H_05190 [Planctomycetota bacterium]